MTNRSGNIGTAGETAVVRALIRHGFPSAERRRLRGSHDMGDVTGTPGLCWEVKAGNAARNASDAQIDAWMHDTALETVHAQAEFGILVVARKGIGGVNAQRWWAILPVGDLFALCKRGDQLNYLGPAMLAPLRMHLSDVCQLLVANGYGTEPVRPPPLGSTA